jgi:hypothetical protein
MLIMYTSTKTCTVSLPSKRRIDLISDKEPSETYLDDLESRLVKKFKPIRDFEDVIFLKSPHNNIMQAEGLKTDRLRKLQKELERT